MYTVDRKFLWLEVLPWNRLLVSESFPQMKRQLAKMSSYKNGLKTLKRTERIASLGHFQVPKNLTAFKAWPSANPLLWKNKKFSLMRDSSKKWAWCVIGTLHRLCHPVFSVLPEDYFFALLPFKSWCDHNISLFNSKQRSAYLVLFLPNILTHYPAC